MNGLPALIWGATGQAKVVRPILAAHGHVATAIYDRDPAVPSPFPDLPRLEDEAALRAWIEAHRAKGSFAVAIGGARGRDRVEIGARLISDELEAPVLVHPRAWSADTASFGAGCQVLALAAVSECAALGDFCIVNTRASVDHDCRLGAGVHVMPGATLAGEVLCGDFATIGSGAVVLPRVRIGTGAFVGAGAVVTADVPAGANVVGIPARSKC